MPELARPARAATKTRRLRRAALLALTAAGALLVGTVVPATASAAGARNAPVQVRATWKHKTYEVGQRPVLKVKATSKSPAKKHGKKKTPAAGKVVVTVKGVKGKKTTARLHHGKATLKLPKQKHVGRFTVKITVKGRGLKKRTIKKKLVVTPAVAPWNVPDAELRKQIRSALHLAATHVLTLADAARLNNTNGAALFFGDVRTAAGLEKATHLTQLTSLTAGYLVDTRGLDNIVRVNGDVWISNAITHASLPRVQYIGGELEAFNIASEHLQSISLPALTDVEEVEIADRPQLQNVSLPRLRNVRGDVTIKDDPALTALALPALATVTGELWLQELDNATGISLPALRDAEVLYVTDAARARTLELDALTTVRGTLQVSNLPELTGLALPALQHIDGDLTLYFLGSITTLQMPALQWSHGHVSFGIGDDFPALPRDGDAVAFPMLDIAQATDFGFSVNGASSTADTITERWYDFLAWYGAALS